MIKPAESLCVSCGNFASGCSWSRDFTPVEGWKAIPNTSVLMGGRTYDVKECPEFVPDSDDLPNDIYDAGVENLVMAIIRAAIVDYINALNYGNSKMRKEVEEWVESDYADYLTGGLDLNYILREARKKHREFDAAAERYWRKRPDKKGEVRFECPFCGGTAVIKKLRNVRAARCSCGCSWSKSRITRRLSA